MVAFAGRLVLGRIRLGPGFFSYPLANHPERRMRTGVSRGFRELPPAPIVCLGDAPISVPFVAYRDRAPIGARQT